MASSLSLVGRITLAKSVLQAMPTYAMQTSYLPKSICDDLEKLLRNFIWGFTLDKKKVHLVNWNTMKQPIDHGGLGLKDLCRNMTSILSRTLTPKELVVHCN
ncbi:hypothetical protein GQ457_07G007270 [Hibiscus cannabinus]